MRRKDPITEIRRRWRVRELVLEWQRLPEKTRADVIGELEESAREIGGEDGRARLIAADALEAAQNPMLFQGLESVAEDITWLLEEIDRLKPPGSSAEPDAPADGGRDRRL